MTEINDGLVSGHHDSGVGNVLDELGGQAAVDAADTLFSSDLSQRLPECSVATSFFTHPRTRNFYNVSKSQQPFNGPLSRTTRPG